MSVEKVETIETSRFGKVSVQEEDTISLPYGVLGFSDHKKFCLIDSGDDTLILWLQALNDPNLVFPVLEPKIFKSDYKIKLSPGDLRDLGLNEPKNIAVFSILTIPTDVTQMTANLKAPIIVNRENQIAKQVVLQENEYSVQYEMFNALKAHLLTIRSQQQNRTALKEVVAESIRIKDLPTAQA